MCGEAGAGALGVCCRLCAVVLSRGRAGVSACAAEMTLGGSHVASETVHRHVQLHVFPSSLTVGTCTQGPAPCSLFDARHVPRMEQRLAQTGESPSARWPRCSPQLAPAKLVSTAFILLILSHGQAVLGAVLQAHAGSATRRTVSQALEGNASSEA